MSFTSKKVCHLTSVHRYNDIRIFLKECKSLAQAGYCVHLVAPHVNDCVIDGVNIHGVNSSKDKRFHRITRTVWSVYRAAKAIDACIYHLHDPELLPVGLLLKIKGKKVIYDAHEDLPRQILTKPWIWKFMRLHVANIAELFENIFVRFVDGIVAATPHIAKRFERYSDNVTNVNNYPLLQELIHNTPKKPVKLNVVCYVGNITEKRGIIENIIAAEKAGVKLLLAGQFSPVGLYDSVNQLSAWKNVEYKGYIDRKGIKEILNSSIAGLVTVHPEKNYLDGLPIKMFEYMAAGIPVIASNFPIWESIVEGNRCGIRVDPMKPEAIANAIEWIVQHPVEAEEMGNNGRKAVENTYNWDIEKAKLLTFYEGLI